MKALRWIIPLCGLWEAGDVLAFVTPGFGQVPAFMISHILTGLLLVVAGVWAARTHSPATARRLGWLTAGGGVWLVIAPKLLNSHPAQVAGLSNDLVVGALVTVLGLWSAIQN